MLCPRPAATRTTRSLHLPIPSRSSICVGNKPGSDCMGGRRSIGGGGSPGRSGWRWARAIGGTGEQEQGRRWTGGRASGRGERRLIPPGPIVPTWLSRNRFKDLFLLCLSQMPGSSRPSATRMEMAARMSANRNSNPGPRMAAGSAKAAGGGLPAGIRAVPRRPALRLPKGWPTR